MFYVIRNSSAKVGWQPTVVKIWERCIGKCIVYNATNGQFLHSCITSICFFIELQHEVRLLLRPKAERIHEEMQRKSKIALSLPVFWARLHLFLHKVYFLSQSYRPSAKSCELPFCVWLVSQNHIRNTVLKWFDGVQITVLSLGVIVDTRSCDYLFGKDLKSGRQLLCW